MHMHGYDWLIVGSLLLGLMGIALYASHYSRGVTDFLAAGRAGGRYLLTTAEGAAGIGAITIIALFQQYYTAGFAASWWGQMLAPIGLIMAISGWVIYRFRETRALTLAEFFERRYSRRFRIFAGILAWGVGILNYGIFPGITARFFIYFCGLPDSIEILGFAISTFPLVMFICLSLALVFTFSGGQVAVMVTDFVQGLFINVAFLLIMIVLFMKFPWGNVVDTLKQAPPGKSMLNPFDQGSIPAFTFTFFAVQIFMNFYTRMAWQGTQGYNASAKSPHEAKMAQVLAQWRAGVMGIMVIFMPVAAYVMLHNTDYAAEAAAARSAIEGLNNPDMARDMTVPIALAEVLPTGMVGLFTAVMLAAALSTDTTYLHSWGSIFIQDVVLPLRGGRPIAPRQHLMLLRLSVLGVAVFAFFFSLLFPLRDYIFNFFNITGAIYLGGIGAAIIGGLYWSRGTTAGAWAGVIVGSSLAVSGTVLQAAWSSIPALAGWRERPPLDGTEMSFFAAVLGCSVYAIVSLLSGSLRGRPHFNMEWLLHRGSYRIEQDRQSAAPVATGLRALGWTNEFTRGDKIIYALSLGWTVVFFSIFVVGTIWGLTVGFSTDAWARWWRFQLLLWACIGTGTTVWFLVGGSMDLRDLYRALRREHFERIRRSMDEPQVPVGEAPAARSGATMGVVGTSQTPPRVRN